MSSISPYRGLEIRRNCNDGTGEKPKLVLRTLVTTHIKHSCSCETWAGHVEAFGAFGLKLCSNLYNTPEGLDILAIRAFITRYSTPK
jgi:hypothetical protein